MEEIYFNSVQEFNDYYGFETLHPLVSVVRLSATFRSFLQVRYRPDASPSPVASRVKLVNYRTSKEASLKVSLLA